MAYTKQTWASGDTITAAKLNHIEDGIENASPWDAVIRLVHSNDSGADCDATLTPSIVSGTFAELSNKISNGGYPCILVQYYHPFGWQFSEPAAHVAYLGADAITIAVAGYSPMADGFSTMGWLVWHYTNTINWD